MYVDTQQALGLTQEQFRKNEFVQRLFESSPKNMVSEPSAGSMDPCNAVPVERHQQRQKRQLRCLWWLSGLAAASQRLPVWPGLHDEPQGQGPQPEGPRREGPCWLPPQLRMTALLPSWPATEIYINIGKYIYIYTYMYI